MRARIGLQREIFRERRDVAGLLLRGAVMVFVVAAIALAVEDWRRDDGEGLTVLRTAGFVDPLAIELARCRTITAEQNSADDTCRHAWAENRRRFFAPTSRAGAVTTEPAAAVRDKRQDRVPSDGVQPDRNEVP